MDSSRSSLSPATSSSEGGRGSWAGNTAPWVEWLVRSEGPWPELASCCLQRQVRTLQQAVSHGAWGRLLLQMQAVLCPRNKMPFCRPQNILEVISMEFCGCSGKFFKCPWGISFKTGTSSCCIDVCQIDSLNSVPGLRKLVIVQCLHLDQAAACLQVLGIKSRWNVLLWFFGFLHLCSEW